MTRSNIVKIDNVTVYLDENRLLIDDKAVIVEPKVMALLSYFIEHPNQVLSKDQLLEQVWLGTVVSDNALSWSISQLRKVLGDKASSPRFIKTISKKGYVFIAPVSFGSQKPKPKPADVEHHGSLLVRGLVVVAVVIMAATFYLYHQTSPTGYQLTQHQFVTRMSGREEDPQLSPDGQMLLFRHKANQPNSQFQLYLKPMSENRSFKLTDNQGKLKAERADSSRFQRSFRLNDDNGHYHYAIWSADGYKIYAIRSDHLGCELLELSLPVTRDRVTGVERLAQCHPHGHSKLALAPQAERLFFTDKSEDGMYQLFGYDLKTSEVQTLTEPTQLGFGERFIDHSAVTNKLLILRDIGWATSEFIEYDLSTGKTRTLLSLDARYYTAFWGPQGAEIWLNWGNDKVKAYDWIGHQYRDLLHSANGWNYAARPSTGSLGFYITSDANSSDLWFYASDFANQTTAFAETHGVFAHHSEQLAFVSNESGLPQVWLQQPGQASQQLTNAQQYFELNSLQWSMDDNYLLGLSGNILASVELSTSTFRLHYQSELRPFYPSWSHDNKHIIFSAKAEQDWQLYRVAVTGAREPAQLIDIGPAYLGQPLADGHLLFSRADRDGLWRYDQTSQEKTLLLPELPRKVYWKMLDDQLYFIATTEGRKWLFQTSLNQYQPKGVVALPAQSGDRFDLKLNPATGKVSFVITDYGRYDSDIKSMRISYQ